MSADVSAVEPTIDIIPRKAWFPHTMPRPPDFMKFPIEAVYWTNVLGKTCNTEEACRDHIREVQLFHIKGGQFDIPYNFVIGPKGQIYEGRGWGWGSVMPFTKEDLEFMRKNPLQDKALVIGHIGNKIVEDPDHPMVKSTLRLIEYGVQTKKIKPDYETVKQTYWINYDKYHKFEKRKPGEI